MTVTVYCASSAQIDQSYFEATRHLAQHIVQANITVLFGGGAEGLMGELANVIVSKDGSIRGIMPRFMKNVEWAHPKVTDFIFTETMAERKELLFTDTDAIIALPGGTGTLEELLEVITMKRLGKFLKPIIILNTNNYYDPLKEMLQRCVDQKFMHPKHLKMWTFVDTPQEVIPTILATPDWEENALSYATLKQTDL